MSGPNYNEENVQMEATEVIAAIARGQLDADLETIIDTATNRKRITARSLASLLKPGDRVRLTGIRPRILDGATGVVQDISRTRIGVVIDKEFARGAGRFARSITMGLPLRVPNVCVVLA
jgi:hypothetical protein